MTPAPVRQTQVETVRVPVTDLRANAIEEALAREMKAWPRHEPIVNRIRSVAESILHGEKMKSAGRGRDKPPSQTIGLGWSDPTKDNSR